MKRVRVFGGSLGYREDLMIPTFCCPAGHTGQNSPAPCKLKVEKPFLLMVLSYGPVVLSLGPRDEQKQGRATELNEYPIKRARKKILSLMCAPPSPAGSCVQYPIMRSCLTSTPSSS